MVKTYTGGSTRFGLMTRALLFAIVAIVGFSNAALATCTINGGTIGSNQTGCAPFDPAPLINVTSVSSPFGGPFAYIWLVTTDAGAVAGSNQNWTVIESNTATYDPGPITQTTWYRRCARRAVSICPNYDGESNWVKITVNPTPTANITGNLAITAGQSTTLTATGGGTYAWSTGATSAAITVSPTATTNYTVTVSSNGCTATKTVTVTVTPAGPDCNQIVITPGQGVINISGLTAPVIMVQVYNSSWASVFNQNYSNQPGSISIPNLPAGSYFVKVDFLTASWQAICKKEGFFTVTGDSNPCSITASITNKTCNNNGTPNNPNDDTYSFTLTVNGTNTSGTWQGGYSNAYLGTFQFGPTAYGTPINLGPFPAANFTPSNVQPPITLPNGVDISINVNDSQNSSCSASTIVTSTGGCSSGGGGTPDCNAITLTAGNGAITATGLTAPVVMLQVFNAQWAQVFSQTYTNSPGSVTVPSLAAGTYFVKASLLNASWALICAKEAYVTVTGGGGGTPCSITAVVGPKVCNDNGTPNNAADDTFTFTLTVNKTGDCSPGWHGPIGNQNFSGNYGVATTIGPFSIASNPSVDIWVMDNTNADAQFDITIQAPAPCSGGGGGGTPDCNAITTTGSNGTITLGGLTAPITMVQIFNSSWAVAFNQTYNSAPGTVTVPNLPAGQYFVKVNFLTAGWQSICAKEVYVTVTGGGGTTPSLTINDVTVNENAGTATLQICASAASTSPITVVYSTTPNTAVAGSDYTTTSATATIPAGETCVNVTIPIVDDNVNEPTEVFHVYLSNATGATIADLEGLVTILDNDSAPGGDCNAVNITGGAGTISISGLTAPIVMVQAFNAAWAPVFNQTYTTPPGSVSIPNLPAGQYFVKVSFLTATWQSICNKEVFVNVTGGNTGVLSLTCPIDMTVTAAQGATSAVVNYNSPSASTTCSGGTVNVTRTSGPATGSAFPLGTTQVCFKATDNCGNEKTCCFNVTVNAPAPTVLTLTCTQNVTVTAAPGATTAVVNYTAPLATTTCTNGSPTTTRTSGPASGSAFPVGTTQVCFQSTDNCGNVKTCCFSVTVNDGGPVCTATRTVSNSKENCGAGTAYGLWINVAYPGTTCKTFSISGATFTENADGTAKLTGVASNTCNANIKFNIDVDFCGRTFAAPAGSPKTTTCYNTNANGWYYYTTMCGTLTGTNSAAGAIIKITRRGEAFQVGTGANLNENVFGASGWFNMYVTAQPTSGGYINAVDGDININLSGSATAAACGNGSANCNSVACFTGPQPMQVCSVGGCTTYTGEIETVAIGNSMNFSEARDNCNQKASSAATLTIPAGSTIKKATLYWSGTGTADNSVSLNGTNVNSSNTKTHNEPWGSYTLKFFAASADVTSMVTGGGTFTVSNLAWSNSYEHCQSNSAYGAWSLVVVYENVNLPVNVITICDDKFEFTYPSGTYNATMTNCNSGVCAQNAKLTIVAFEGDNYKTENFYVNGALQSGNNNFRGQTAPNLDIFTVNVTSTNTNTLTVGLQSYLQNTIWGSASEGTFIYVKIWKYTDCNSNRLADNDGLTFNARKAGSTAKLNWLSNTGDRNDYFIVERSSNQTDWAPILKVNGQGAAGESMYFSEVDAQPLKGENYYRLQQVFRDGTIAYSNIEQVLMPTSAAFALFPNPTSGEVFVDLSEFEGQPVSIRLVDVMGKIARTVVIEKATAQAARLDLQGFDNGIYQVEMVSGGIRRVSKLVVSTLD